MANQYFIRWLDGYGWYVGYGRNLKRLYPITGFRGSDLHHVMTWCGSCDVTILPA